MKYLAFVFLAACSGDVFAIIGPGADAELDAGIDSPEMMADGAELDARADVSPDVVIDVVSEDGETCGTDGGACSAGSCCSGLHCFAAKCTSCKPDGVIALSGAECCNPSGFANYACGGVKTCAAPNYDKCGPSNNGMLCCGGAQCKQNGQVWACACGGVDAPCHIGNDFECCSNVCGQGGWCQ